MFYKCRPWNEIRSIKLCDVIINLQAGMITFLYFERENSTKTNVSSQKSVGIIAEPDKEV